MKTPFQGRIRPPGWPHAQGDIKRIYTTSDRPTSLEMTIPRYEKEIRARVNEMGISQSVEFIERQPADRMASYL
jgi:hypothetical protein